MNDVSIHLTKSEFYRAMSLGQKLFAWVTPQGAVKKLYVGYKAKKVHHTEVALLTEAHARLSKRDPHFSDGFAAKSYSDSQGEEVIVLRVLIASIKEGANKQIDLSIGVLSRDLIEDWIRHGCGRLYLEVIRGRLGVQRVSDHEPHLKEPAPETHLYLNCKTKQERAKGVNQALLNYKRRGSLGTETHI